MQLGPFEIEHPFILAPMAGITNAPFRRLMKRLGSSVVVSELVSANGIQYGGKKTLDLLRYHDDERVVGLQIFGDEPENLVRAAQYVEKLGADFVDLNLGCPVVKITKKGAGAAMCRNVPELARTLDAMVRAVKIPVTIKIRTGWDSDSLNAHEVVRAAADVGVAWVAIHGRTRAQAYKGLADWEFIGSVKAKSSIPILGNGDITTAEIAVERMRTYGVDAVLIGRGALRNPFLFEQARALWRGEAYQVPNADRYLQLMRDQRALLEEDFDPGLAGLHVRKFMAWYSSGFPGASEFRRKVFSVADTEELWREAAQFFETSIRSRDMRFMAEPFLMGGHG